MRVLAFVVLAVGLVQQVVALTRLRQPLDVEGHHVYLSGSSGDDGSSEGLFGQYFDVPFLSTADNKPVAHVKMQLAITEDEDHHGLMYRKQMPDEDGMLFLYRGIGQRVLYMRNTFIDLDAAWLSHNGTLLEVQKLNKLDETWRWSKSEEVQWGLEMNIGWFAHHDVKPGLVKLDLSAVASAIAARGFNPAQYGLQAAGVPTVAEASAEATKTIADDTFNA